MSTPKVIEGEVAFSIPAAGKQCKTWYKVIGDLKSGTRPLVCLHGGPGVAHDYLLSLLDLNSKYSIPLIFYDQVGTGRSTHLSEKMGDTKFWSVQLFLDELDNLLAHLGVQNSYDVLGQSWGGMLGASHAAKQPKGLNRLIISNSPASMILWVEAQDLLRTGLPKDVQDTLTMHEKEGTTDSKEYEAAVEVFYSKHLCRLDPRPTEVDESLDWVKKDPTVYLTMNGPSEFYVTGLLKNWSIIHEAHKIVVPTLLLNGRYDEAQDSVVEPFFKEISKVKWVTFAESSHMPHWEERESYMEVVNRFLVSA